MAEFSRSDKNGETQVPKHHGRSLGERPKEQGIRAVHGDVPPFATEADIYPNLGETEASETKPYTSAELSKLTFLSFRFSQGSIPGQKAIIDYIVAQDPTRISQDVLDESLPSASKHTEQFIGNTVVHGKVAESGGTSHEGQMAMIGNYWSKAIEAPKEPEGIDYSVRDIHDEIIAKDFTFLVERDGRPRKNSDDDQKDNPLTRTHMSHLVYYGLLGEPTGDPLYDQMFEDIVGQLPKNWDHDVYSDTRLYDEAAREKNQHDPTYIGVLGDVVRELAEVHFAHYPQDLEKLPEQWKKQLEPASN